MELWGRIGSRNKKGRVKLSANGRTTPNIGGPTMLGVLASVLAVVYKRMQELPTLLGPAVHRGKDTTHKTLESMCNARAGPVDATLGSLSNDDSDRNENGKKKKKSNWFRFWQNNGFARASRFFVHFLAVVARLQRGSASFHVLSRTGTQDKEFLFLFLNFDTVF